MTGRRAIAGLCLLCALAFSAIAAQGAAAVTGTTAFTCVKNPIGGVGEKFSKAHCKEADTSPIGEYRHVAVAQDTTTDITITNEKTNPETNAATKQVLKATVGGTAIELTATGVHGVGGLENKVEPGEKGEHYVEVGGKAEHALVLTYTGVTEDLLGCTVTGLPGGVGKVETKPLKGTTTGQGDSIKFEPIAPGPPPVFAEFELTGGTCSVGPVTIKVVGNITCVPNGATINCNHEEVTAQKGLRIGSAAGKVAGLEGSVTVLGKDTSIAGDEFKPLSVTTVPTP